MSGPVTSEYVAVDEPRDEAAAPRRPVGAQLAVIGEQVARAPGEATERVLFQELPAIWHGGRQLVLDVRHWRRNDARFAELAADKAFAARQGMLPARIESERQKAVDEARRRWAVLIAYVAGAFVLVTVASVVGFWSWHPWRLFGPALMLVQLAVARYYRQARRLSAVLMGSSWLWVPVFLALDITDWRWWPWWIAGGLLLLACEQRGMRMARAMPDGRRGHAPGESRSWSELAKDVTAFLSERRGKPVTRSGNTTPIVSDGVDCGVSLGLHSPEPVTGEDVRALEREFGYPVGASGWVADPRVGGAGDLRLCWLEPLPPMTAPRREPMSLSYVGRFPVARRDGGQFTWLGLARVRVVLVGNSGAGKSQAMQTLLDAVADMPDASFSGVDVQEGPTLKAYARQWNCTSVHYTRDEALAHLRELRALCVRRNRRLDEGVDDDLDGEIDQWWVVGEEPDRRGHVLFIDELSSLTADKECREELILLLEVCRKASVSVVMATPDLETSRVPPAVRDQAGVKVAFGCPFSDAMLLFGKGSTQSGWEPWTFVPADDEGPNDAGKSYVLGAGYNRPEVHRWFALPKEEIVARNRARRLWRERFAQPLVVVDDDPEVIDAEIVTEEDVAREAAVRRALDLCGDREGLPVAEMSGGLTSDEEAAVRAAAPPRTVYLASLGKPVRCVPRSALVNALHDGASGAA